MILTALFCFVSETGLTQSRLASNSLCSQRRPWTAEPPASPSCERDYTQDPGPSFIGVLDGTLRFLPAGQALYLMRYSAVLLLLLLPSS